MFNITIDGNAGCGKSTLAEEIAKNLGLKKFNTGAVYRGITCEYKAKHKNKMPNTEIIKNFIKNLKIKINFKNNIQNVVVNKTDYTPHLRDEDISALTPIVSSFDELRELVRQVQRDFAKENDCVMEGRDIGTVVLPKSSCKLFITASDEVRAKRRFEQLKNAKDAPKFEELLKELKERDNIDIHREHGTLLPAKDAVIIDNSNETVEQTLQRCLKIINEKQKNI